MNEQEVRITINLGLVIKGEIGQMKELANDIQGAIKNYPDVKLVYHTQSAKDLWIEEGE